MGLTKGESAELKKLRKITKGSKIKVTHVRGTGNVRISGEGSPVFKQLGMGSATTVTRAKIRVKKRRVSRSNSLGLFR